MGVYIFTYSVLRRMLVGDARKKDSSHDFGKDIIPTMLAKKMKLFAYVFKGYWKDVGTISSLHEANMDLLLSSKGQNIYTIKGGNTIFSEDTHSHPQYIGRKARVKDCLINQGAVILGDVERSVISNEVVVAEGAVVKNSVLMPGARIRAGAKVFSAIVGPEAIVSHGEVVNEKQEDIVLITTRRKNNGK